MDDPKAPTGASSVCFDLRAGASQLADHLITLGHRTIMYLDTPRPVATFADRRRYLTDQLRRQHKDVRVLRTHSDIEIGAARAKVLANWPSWAEAGVTAIVAASDVQAYGVLGALADLKVDVPGRVFVASFDDLPVRRDRPARRSPRSAFRLKLSTSVARPRRCCRTSSSGETVPAAASCFPPT